MDELRSLAGQEVAVSDWLEITQERIAQFANATGDHQWIHLDVQRCRAESPFGAPIAHGFLSLSLLAYFHGQSLRFRQPFSLIVNYGLNKVRFPHPVPAGSRVRCRTVPLEVTAVPGGWQVRWQQTVEIEGKDKPAVVAETITRFYEPGFALRPDRP